LYSFNILEITDLERPISVAIAERVIPMHTHVHMYIHTAYVDTEIDT